MLFDGEHARRVIQLLADVLSDALKLAAAGALGVFRFVMNYGAWKMQVSLEVWKRCRLLSLRRCSSAVLGHRRGARYLIEA